ncbi:Serine dehydratase [Paragonimus heterotremus]|uniref:L-serine ammonia-lyase n=1 Tax=Paragonimus heterotremus TaxID=100268 RepID=A0A8J4SIQ3_9TREM|nr:Serine dehydratase [Paragonimus heterotremus]
MHANGCVNGSLSDIFPSIPLQDPISNASLGCSLLNMNGLNGNTDVASRMKYLGLNLPAHINHTSPSSSVFFNEDRSRTNLIINYLPQSYDQNDLQRLFERVGPIRQCKLIRDKNTGASLCYGFVDFVNPQHAALAIQTYHGYETEQKRLRVAYASSGGRRFTPGHRMPTLSNGSNNSACLGSEVTNENVIGWEVFVVGIPLEWTESDLLRLFTSFGNVILIRLLAPQLSESPPSHKARMSSPVLNGAPNDASSESPDGGRLTTTASIIFEEKSHAEQSVLRLNGYHAPEWSAPLRLRIIGSVTRETYGHFCYPTRQSPALMSSRIPNSHPNVDPLTESEAINNLLNRKALSAANCITNGHFMKPLEPVSASDLHTNAAFGVPPRAIIRNKVNDSASSILSHANLSHGQTLELLDLLDGQSTLPTSNSGLLSATERLVNRDLSLVSTLSAQRASEQDHSKLDQSLRALSNQNSSPWIFPQQRSVLSTLPETGRGSDVLNPNWLSGGLKRVSIKSPVVPSPILTNIVSQRSCQAHVWLKLENVQPTGSFKIRGMENVCRKWAASGITHVVCPSGGNAAIAAAYCAQASGLACTVVIPEPSEASVRRRLSLEAPDTKVIVHGNDWLEALHRAEQLVNDLQNSHSSDPTVRLLHPFDQPDLWEGYEVIIDELTPEVGQPDVVILPVGGGGLLAGVIQGLWNRGWSSTHVIAVETEGADCLNRSMKAGQLLVVPRAASIATSLVAPVLAHRSWNLAQLQSLTPITCTDFEALDAVRHFLDDHGMLVEPACGAALSVVYSGIIGRLQLEGRIPRPANVVIIITGGRNVSLRQLSEWENQLSPFGSSDHMATAPFLPPMANPYITRTSPHSSICSDLMGKQSVGFGQQLAQDHDETLKIGTSPPNTRAVCTILNRPPTTTNSVDLHTSSTIDREGNSDNGTLNPHDLVNFSKLLAQSEAEGDDGLRE